MNHAENEPVLGFTGLCEFWADPTVPGDDPIRRLLSCTGLTAITQDARGHVHDKSVIIPRDRFVEWLDPDLNDVQHVLDSLPEPTLTPRIVSTRVNSVRNNEPGLTGPAE